MNRLFFLFSLAGLVACAGCGSEPSAPSDAEIGGPAQLFATEVRQAVFELRDALGGEGVGAVRDALVGVSESYPDGAAGQDVGSHGETYQQIFTGINELQQMFEGGEPAAADVQAKVAELVQLAEQLPGGEGGEDAAGGEGGEEEGAEG